MFSSILQDLLFGPMQNITDSQTLIEQGLNSETFFATPIFFVLVQFYGNLLHEIISIRVSSRKRLPGVRVQRFQSCKYKNKFGHREQVFYLPVPVQSVSKQVSSH